MPPSKVLKEILNLDPKKDHQHIVHLHLCYDFPWDTNRALEFALFRTFAVPSISAILDSAGEFHNRPQRRYDDTGLLLAEMLEWGYQSKRGQRALNQINKIHSYFDISNDDYLYVLSTFIYEPIRWNQKFGWRPMVEQEKLAMFYFWREVGLRMNIRDIPENFCAFESLSRDYENQHFCLAKTNQKIAIATRNLFLSWFPKLLHPLVKQLIYAFLDEKLLEAFGFPKPYPGVQFVLHKSLKIRSKIVYYLPRRIQPFHYTKLKGWSYPNGYKIEDLGPQNKEKN